jgi:hypothetical protein
MLASIPKRSGYVATTDAVVEATRRLGRELHRE